MRKDTPTFCGCVGTLCGCALLAIALDAAALPLGAQSVPLAGAAALATGTVIPSVPCARYPGQSYALYLPSKYTAEQQWPILYAFDPGGQGSVPVNRMKDLAEKYGYIVAGSNNSKNGPIQPQMDAAQAVWQDTHDRLSIDDRRLYATGFSGGARAATMFALLCNDCAAGVFAQGAGFPTQMPPSSSVHFAYFMSVGELDFNYPELFELAQQLEELGIPNRLRHFDGPHQWAPPEVWAETIAWIELLAMRDARRDKDERFIAEQYAAATARANALEQSGAFYAAYEDYRRLAREFQGLADTTLFARKAAELKDSSAAREGARREREEIAEQRRLSATLFAMLTDVENKSAQRSSLWMPLLDELHRLQGQAKSTKARGKTWAARRALSHVLARAYEDGLQALREKDSAKAGILFEFAAEAAPHSAGIFFQLARAQALAGRKKKMLEALERAITNGFRDAALVEASEEFAPFRSDPEFQKILARLAPAHPAQDK